MNRTEFEHLAKKYLEGTISPEEEKLLSAHYDVLQQKVIPWDQHDMGMPDEVKIELYNKVLSEIAAYDGSESKHKRSFKLFNWSVAAALISIVSMALFFYMKEPARQVVKNTKSVMNDVLPGGNKAVLILADGSEVNLDNADEGILTTQGNIIIDKNKDGQLVYRINANAKPVKQNYNIIRTPAGGQYQLELSDHTRVWLNAGSSIKFPTVFSGTERLVTLEGEAYFEVSKDKQHPFRVATAHQLVEVLGTHFNVNAYSDEAVVKTTLLEGSVRIVYGDLSKVIKPGEQARLSGESGKMEIAKVDLEEAVSWKNGYFLFDNEDIHSVMRKISRWYNVEVVFLNDQMDERFGGTVSKFGNVSQVLKILEATGSIHFKIEGRRITVMQ
jgi:transmembrane sensor